MSTVNLVIGGAGLFSKFMIGVQNAIRSQSAIEADNLVFTINDKRIRRFNPFDHLFDQDYSNITNSIRCRTRAPYRNILSSSHLPKLKSIVSKIKIKDEIIREVDRIMSVESGKTLGVHIRLTDMDRCHGDIYGFKSFDDYLEKIKEVVESRDIEAIFVASDNLESIKKIEKIYGNMVNYAQDMIRSPQEKTELTPFFFPSGTENNFTNIQFWKEALIECLALSRCDCLVYRVSNLSIASVVFSDTIKETFLI